MFLEIFVNLLDVSVMIPKLFDKFIWAKNISREMKHRKQSI